jgi:hypothetical protein
VISTLSLCYVAVLVAVLLIASFLKCENCLLQRLSNNIYNLCIVLRRCFFNRLLASDTITCESLDTMTAAVGLWLAEISILSAIIVLAVVFTDEFSN